MTTKIHPTAIVTDGAIIHDDVIVGPYSIIGESVEIGSGTIIYNHVNITGHTKIGNNNKIYHFSSLGEVPQDKKYNNEITYLEIGNNNVIREFCTFNTGTIQGGGVTRLGSNNWIMAYVHLAHDCIVGDNIIMANNVALAGHVTVKDWVILGGHALVHQFSVIGEHSMVAGATGVAQDIPPYIMAHGYRAEPKGINVEGLKRRGFTGNQIENIKHAYKLIYRNGLALNEAKSQIAELCIEQPELKLFLDFFEISKRGIIR